MKTLYLFALMSVFIACTKNARESLGETGTAMQSDKQATALASFGEKFIIDLSNVSDIASVRGKISKLGAEETGYVPELKMMFVNTTNPGSLLSEGFNVAVDLETYVEPMAFPDNPSSIGSDDSWFPVMWGLDAIDAPQAWNLGYTGKGVTVAVLDVGFYLNHTDLRDNLLLDKARNFVDWGPAICASRPECNPNDASYKGPFMGFSHATHVAGTIAAIDNKSAVIGVAPHAKILPVKVLSDYTRSGWVSWIVKGIVYAADNGAQVINMSLGGLGLRGAGKGSNIVQEGIRMYNKAIQYAKEKGVVVVAAAGNDGFDFDHKLVLDGENFGGSVTVYPASSPHAIAVSATTTHKFIPFNPSIELDHVSWFTNYGMSLVDVAAPGGGGLRTVPWRDDNIVSLGPPGFVTFASGTSMAAPHVSGVAALIIGKYGGNISPAEVKNIILNTSDDLGKPGKDPYYGHGRVNAWKAVQ